MSSIFVMLDEDDTLRKVNIDDLYEKQKARDLKQIGIFHKILNRIHTRIKTVSRTKRNDRHIWYAVPEFLFGEPVYDKNECIAYVVAKLEENGFSIKYVHPNTLFISWDNWVPTYVRNEIKKKRGLILDEKGNVIKVLSEEKVDEDADLVNNPVSNTGPAKPPGKQYTPIGSYKPSGKLVYQPEMFDKIEQRITEETEKKKDPTKSIKNVVFNLP
jgi:hypothetical protein